MGKKYLLFTVLLLFSGLHGICYNQFMVSDTFLNLVYQRYYYIQKLNPFFKAFKIRKYQHTPEVQKLDTSSFEHPLILQSTKAIKSTGKLDSLFRLWKEFEGYKNIEDSEFTTDFLKEVKQVASIVSTKEINVDNSLVLEHFESIKTDAIFSRFYFLQRIEHAAQGVCIGYSGLMDVDAISYKMNLESLTLSVGTFKDYRIINCFKEIIIQKSFIGYHKLWQYCKSYQALEDKVFEKEFALFTYYWYQQMIQQKETELHIVQKQHNKTDIDNFSLEEILDALDYLTDELPIFLEKYEIKSNLTWKQWLKKYGIVAPIAIGAFVIRFYLKLKKT